MADTAGGVVLVSGSCINVDSQGGKVALAVFGGDPDTVGELCDSGGRVSGAR